MEEEDMFFQEVVEGSKRLLLESKTLVELVNGQCEEEDVIESARKTALATFELIDLVSKNISEQYNNESQQYLLDVTKEARSIVLELIKAARTVFSNPMDFLSKQSLDQCRNEVVKTIKTVIQAAENLQTGEADGEEEGEAELPEFDVVFDTRTANKALQAIFQNSKLNVPLEVFLASVKTFLDSMNQLILISKTLSLELDDRLKIHTLNVVSSAKDLGRDQTSFIFQRKFQEAVRECQTLMKEFIFKCSKSKEGATAFEGEEVIPPSPEILRELPPLPPPEDSLPEPPTPTPHVQPMRPPTTMDLKRRSLQLPRDTVENKFRSSSIHTSLPKCPPTPEPPSSFPKLPPSPNLESLPLPPPPPHVGPTSWSAPSSPAITPQSPILAQQSPAITSTPLPMVPPPTLHTPSTPLVSSASVPSPSVGSFRTASPIASLQMKLPPQIPGGALSPAVKAAAKAPASPLKNPTKSPVAAAKEAAVVAPALSLTPAGDVSVAPDNSSPHHQLAVGITSIFEQSMPSFHKEWEALTPQGRETIIGKMVALIQKSVPSTAGKVPPSPKPLNKNATLRSLKSEDDEAEAMMQLQQIMKLRNSSDWGMMSLTFKSFSRRISRKPALDAPQTSAMIESIPVADIPKKLKDSCVAIGEATIDLLIYVNSTFMAAGPNATKDVTADLSSSAVEHIYSIIRVVLGLCAKWRTETGDDKTKPIPRLTTSSSEEEKTRVYQNLVNRMLLSAVTVIEQAPKVGKPMDKIMSALTTTSSSNMSYVKLKLEENIDMRIYNESIGVRSLAGQLMSALNALFGEQATATINLSNVLQVEAAGRGLALTVMRLADALETLKAIHSTSHKNQGSSLTLERATEDEDKDIWDETGQEMLMDGQVFKGGSLNAIVQRLTSDTSYDTKFCSTCIATYQSFTTPWKLLDKLMQRYHVKKGKVDDKRVGGIQLRVCVVLKYWIENQAADFDSALLTALNDFLLNQLPKDGHGDLSRQLHKQLAQKVEDLSVKKQASLVDPFTSLQVQEQLSPAELFTVLNESEIARQLTLIEFDLFSKIQASELFNQSWNKPKLHHRAPHILNMIGRANHLSFWVASLLMWAQTAAERTKMLTKFILIAQHLHELHNFNTLMGVIAGINMSAVSRLKHTFADLDKKLKDVLDSLQQLLNPSSSFKNYRNELQKCRLPCMPYLGTYLTDLTFMEDGNPDHFAGKGSAPVINFFKRELIYNTLREIRMYQESSYKFPVVEPIHTFLQALPFADEKDLYELSLAREPKDPETPVNVKKK